MVQRRSQVTQCPCLNNDTKESLEDQLRSKPKEHICKFSESPFSNLGEDALKKFPIVSLWNRPSPRVWPILTLRRLVMQPW